MKIRAALLSFVIAGALHAQQAALDLPAQLTPETRLLLTRLVDSARAVRLPPEPIVTKVAEGLLKGADEERIVRAARSLVRQLGVAREIMPAGSPTSVLTAAVSALQAGASRQTIERLVAARKGAHEGELATALVTLTDLAATGVPTESAGSAVATLLARGASAQEYTSLRIAVARDVQVGTPPQDALSARLPELQSAPVRSRVPAP